MSYLIGLGIVGAATLVYLYIKKQSAEALLENVDTKEKVNELGKDIAKNDGLLEAEEEKRAQLEKEKNEKLKDTSVSDLIDFFNNRKK